MVRGEQVDTVVAPAPAAGELGHRDQLDGVDTKVGQVLQVLDRRVEGALGRERADVQLIKDRSASGTPRQPLSPQAKAVWSTTRDGPSTPRGW